MLRLVTFLKFNMKLMTILICSDSSGNPGAEEESKSKKDQQKVSVFCSVPDVLRHSAFIYFFVIIAAPVCLSKN